MFVTLRSATCLEQHAAHPQEDKYYDARSEKHQIMLCMLRYSYILQYFEKCILKRT